MESYGDMAGAVKGLFQAVVVVPAVPHRDRVSNDFVAELLPELERHVMDRLKTNQLRAITAENATISIA
jgi:hypothetical protein